MKNLSIIKKKMCLARTEIFPRTSPGWKGFFKQMTNWSERQLRPSASFSLCYRTYRSLSRSVLDALTGWLGLFTGDLKKTTQKKSADIGIFIPDSNIVPDTFIWPTFCMEWWRSGGPLLFADVPRSGKRDRTAKTPSFQAVCGPDERAWCWPDLGHNNFAIWVRKCTIDAGSILVFFSTDYATLWTKEICVKS